MIGKEDTMNRMTIFTAYAVAFFSLLTAQKAWPQLADSPWPMFQHDLQYTGRSPYAGPREPNLAWSKKASYTEPVIGPGGIIYAWSYTEGRMALRLDGTVAWRRPGNWVQAVGADNTLYCSSGDTVYALYADGSVKWIYKSGAWGPYILLDTLGRVFVDNGTNLICLSHNGTLNWQFQLKSDAFVQNPRFRPALGLDRSIYVRDAEGLKAVDVDNGSLKWVYQIYITSGKPTNSISVGDDGTIYVGNEGTFSDDVILRAINQNGTKKWELKPIPDNLNYRQVRSPAAIGSNSTIYFGESRNSDNDGYFYAVGLDGKIRWLHKVWKGIQGSPIIDADGTIYAVSGNGELFAYDLDGEIKWQYPIQTPWGGNYIESYPAIDSLGTLYVAAGEWSNAKLCAFFKIQPGAIPDLAVDGSNISFDPPTRSVSANDTVKINIAVQELSDKQSAAFDVLFYCDNKSNKIDSVHAWTLAGGKTQVQGVWNTSGFTEEIHKVLVVVKNSTPTETNLLNSETQIEYTFLPFIQKSINAAQQGGTVWVEPGTYYENIKLKSGVVVKSRMGAEKTIIDGMQKASVVTIDSAIVPAVLDGFTITNGKTWSDGGGVNIGRTYFDQTAAIIINNIIVNNEAWSGGGVHVYRSPNSVIRNNLILNNKGDLGAGIYIGQSWCEIHNNTIVNNQGTGIEARGYEGMEPDIRNCIFWGNQQDLSMIAYAFYSNVQNAPSELIQTGCISSDPLFLDPSNHDYRLQQSSPCIDTGDPASPRDPDGTRADMGWKYYDQSATIARIMGRLTDASTGAPVTMAKVCLSGPRTDQVPPNAQGNYVFAVPADTGYTVRIFAPNHAAAQKEHLSAKIGEATVVDFSVTPYPTKITLYPPSDLKGSFSSNKVHLTWQRPKDELAFDDGFYEESVGFLNSQGILAAGPFKPSFYPAKIEKIKVAFDGERAGDKIELLIYLDGVGTATKPASSQLVYTLPNVPIEVGGGFQEIDVSAEGLTLNNGSFFVGIKQVNTVPMYLLLDHSAADGHGFVDDDLNGVFEDLSSQSIHGALAMRVVVSMPSSGSNLAIASKSKVSSPTMMMPDSVRLLAIEKNLPTGLVTKPVTSLKSDRVAAAESEALAMLMTPPQSLSVYRSATSPVELSGANKIATLAASTTFYDDVSLGSSQGYYYVVTAKYPSGENIPSNEVYVDIATGVTNEDHQALPEKYALSQNTPNPFNPETLIHYQLPKQTEVRLEIYNILGELVTTLVDEKQVAGYYTASWNGLDEHGRSVAGGVYLYCLKAGEYVQVRKMSLVR